MTRVKIGAVVAVIMAALTAAAYFMATSRLEASIRSGVETRVARAEGLLLQYASLEALDFMARAQAFARDPEVAKTLGETDGNARWARGEAAMKRFVAGLATVGAKADFIFITDDKGQVVSSDSPIPDAEDLKGRFKALAAALEHGQVSKDVWMVGKVAAKVGVAPVVDPSGAVKGAVVVAEALNAKEARAQADLLGAEVLYFYGDKLSATSFKKGSEIEDLNKYPELAGLARDALTGKPRTIHTTVNGVEYVASAGKLLLNFDDKKSGVIVLESLSAAEEPVAAVGLTIVLLGLAALLVALGAMFVAARLLVSQAEEIEFGVGDIINGNVDYVFKPVGADLDGLANALNVMLARMLGRSEPGEEEEGDGQATAKMQLDEAAAAGSADPEIAALAHEPEEQYFHRLFGEYMAARRAAGAGVEGATFEGFTAKLRLHEANLKKKYNCKAVRFRLVVKGSQVTLKPVPIF